MSTRDEERRQEGLRRSNAEFEQNSRESRRAHEERRDRTLDRMKEKLEPQVWKDLKKSR